MRIVAGTHKGQRLAVSDAPGLRPTSERTREAIFNILRHGADAGLEGIRVLDLFAGTGALGLEALSRGAGYCLFVENHATARGLIRRNIESLNLTGHTRIFRRDAARLGPAGTVAPFGLVFSDPPYGKGLNEQALRALTGGGWLKPGAIVVLEETARAAIEVPDGFARIDRRAYGDTQIVLLKAGV